jgi:peptidoglycan/LPS O-acetylase OafA/YrhL
MLFANPAAVEGGGLAGRTDGVLPSMMFSIYNLEFLFGMAAAALVRSGRLRAPRLILTAGLAGLGLAGGAENAGLMNGYGDLARLAYGIPSALIVMGLAEADQRNLLRVPAVLRSLGVASYSLYLFQFVFIGLAWQVLRFTRLDQSLPATLQLLLLALGAVAGGMVMACGVERPLIGLLRRGLGVRRPRLIPGVKAAGLAATASSAGRRLPHPGMAAAAAVTGKPSSAQPVMPPSINFTGRPSRARRSAARSAPLQCGPAQ